MARDAARPHQHENGRDGLPSVRLGWPALDKPRPTEAVLEEWMAPPSGSGNQPLLVALTHKFQHNFLVLLIALGSLALWFALQNQTQSPFPRRASS